VLVFKKKELLARFGHTAAKRELQSRFVRGGGVDFLAGCPS